MYLNTFLSRIKSNSSVNHYLYFKHLNMLAIFLKEDEDSKERIKLACEANLATID